MMMSTIKKVIISTTKKAEEEPDVITIDQSEVKMIKHLPTCPQVQTD